MAWVTLWDNGKYQIQGEYTTSVDHKANITTFTVHQLYIKSLTQHHTFYNANGKAGIGASQRPGIQTVNLDVPKNGGQYVDLPNDSKEIKNNPDGTAPKSSAWFDFIVQSGVGYDSPNFSDWHSKNITDLMPRADRTGPSFSGLSVNWVTPTRVSIHFDVDCGLSELQYQLGDTWYTLDKETRDFEISGLSPNYTRNIKLWGKRAFNDVTGYSGSLSVTTPKPSAPNKGTASVSNVTPTSATVSWSGFSFNEGADWGHYEASQGDNPDPWKNVGKNTSWTDDRLKPDTKYRWVVKLFDNYGTSSGAVYSDFVTTPKPSAPKLANFQAEIVSPFVINIFPGQGTFSDYSTLDHYDFNIDDGEWLNGGSKAFSLRNLIPGRTYKIGLRIVDNYGTASVACYATVTMPFDQTKVWINVDGKIQKAKVWACDSKGNIKKVKKIYVNVDGVVKHTKTA